MAFPKLLQRLFQNSGAGDKLNTSILPVIPEANLPSTVAYKSNIPTKVSQLTNDSSYVTTTALNNGLSGKLPFNPGSIEMYPGSSAGYGGFIDFHYNSSTADYTSRIIEYSSGEISIYAPNGLLLNDKSVPTGTIPTKTSQLTNDSGFLTNSSGGAISANAYITAQYSNGRTGYIKYSNGFIDQWGLGADSGTITFPVAFTTIYANVMVSTRVQGAVPYIYIVKTSYFNVSNASGNFYWRAIGY